MNFGSDVNLAFGNVPSLSVVTPIWIKLIHSHVQSTKKIGQDAANNNSENKLQRIHRISVNMLVNPLLRDSLLCSAATDCGDARFCLNGPSLEILTGLT